MCGIAGIIGIEESKSAGIIKRMTDAIKHRGPDAEGIIADGIMAFGHRRLSIIDLNHSADQPFNDNSGNYSIIFNGEIYNYKTVKNELDYPWKTNSDTEVILAAYLKWGKDCLQKLNGMFAFAIWDRKKSELFIARDRLGVKPFYYHLDKGILVFSSEIRSLLESDLIERKLDRSILNDYLTYMSIRTPYTMIQGVMQLCPGECAIFKNGKMERSFYWQMSESKKSEVIKSHSEKAELTGKLFKDSIASRMVADVKVGAFLSGGIDSSAVVAMMAEISDKPVETFSIVFEDKDFDESEHSRRIAELYKTRHTELLMKPQDLLENMDGFINAMDSPTVDGINTYMVSKLVAATGIKVVLTGVGGDELFAGYNGFRRWKKFKRVSQMFPASLLSLLAGFLRLSGKKRSLLKISDLLGSGDMSFEAFYRNSRSVYTTAERKALLNQPGEYKPSWLNLNSKAIDQYEAVSQYSIAELSHYTLDVLMKDTDQMSMAHALEVREPFFDYKLLEFVLGLGDGDKLKSGQPKHLFIEAMGNRLPGEIVYRAKKGFTFPWNSWLKNELRDTCESALKSLSEKHIFNQGSVENVWKSFLENKNGVTWLHVWGLVILEKWMEKNKIAA